MPQDFETMCVANIIDFYGNTIESLVFKGEVDEQTALDTYAANYPHPAHELDSLSVEIQPKSFVFEVEE